METRRRFKQILSLEGRLASDAIRLREERKSFNLGSSEALIRKALRAKR